VEGVGSSGCVSIDPLTCGARGMELLFFFGGNRIMLVEHLTLCGWSDVLATGSICSLVSKFVLDIFGKFIF
jgi:hypothetical protein